MPGLVAGEDRVEGPGLTLLSYFDAGDFNKKIKGE
jgi:hypothetical protein